MGAILPDLPGETHCRRCQTLQALCFQIPYLFWKSMATHSGIRAHMLVREACGDKNLDVEVRLLRQCD